MNDGEPRGFHIETTFFPADRPSAGLHVVATPIGNLADVTLRALRILGGADAIVCEDTRISRRLLDRYGIRRPLITYHEHNARKQLPKLLQMLDKGAALALISDAGTPLISDPGYRLVTEAAVAGHRIVPIPGPSAVIAALSSSALPTDAFLFVGFLPPKSGQRKNRLGELIAAPATLVFYEAPQRLSETLADMAEMFGPDRRGVVARELTKTYETIVRGTLAELAECFPPDGTVKGEIVVLLEPGGPEVVDDAEIDRLLAEAMARMSASAAAASVAKATGRSRKSLYGRVLGLKEAGG